MTLGDNWVSAHLPENLPGERTNGDWCNALVSAHQNGGAIGARWGAGITAHFGTHTAIWVKSKWAISQSKGVRKGA